MGHLHSFEPSGDPALRRMRREMVECALGSGVADEADAFTVAAATSHAVDLLAAELKPLVGGLAMRALYVRALHLARSSFQRPITEGETFGELLDRLRQDLGDRAPADARRAAEALLHAFVDLLVSLIGKPLTYRILEKAWGARLTPVSSKEKSQ